MGGRIVYAGAMNDLSLLLDQPVARLGATTVTLGQTLALAVVLVVLLLLLLGVALWRSAKARAVAAADAAERAREGEARMAGILQAQSEMQGRMGAIADVFGARRFGSALSGVASAAASPEYGS